VSFDPPREAGSYTAPHGHYDRVKSLPFLGRLLCGQNSLIAGEFEEIVLTYEIGAAGLADGAWIKLAFKFYSDWALFQTSDPTGADYISAEYHPAPLCEGQSAATLQALKIRFDQKGHERPFQKAVIIDVIDGYLNPGDQIVIRLGDRRHGGPGTRVQSFVERGFRFRLFVDPLGSSKFAEVPGDVLIDILPGRFHALQMVTPRLAGPEESFDVLVRIDDRWGNTCRDAPAFGTLRLVAPDGSTIEQPLNFLTDGWSVARAAGLQLTTSGEWRLEASLPDDAVQPATAFVTIEDLGLPIRPLYADLHVHSDDTVGTNNAWYNLSYGRDVAGLDVLGYTVNDFNITEKNWNHAVGLIQELNQAGRFVCFPGTEWCGNSAAGGDRNVVFLGEGKPRFPFDAAGRSVRSFEWNEFTNGTIAAGAWPVDDLYAAYADDPAGHLLIPHVGGRRCILDWHHPELERLVEITSAWGQFHWLYTEALARGYRVGASAAGDEHQGRCGGGRPATGVFGARGGLTGMIAATFDRQGIGKALRQRRTFATTGERSFASLRFGEDWMGDIVTGCAGEFAYRVLGDAGWEEIALYDADRLIWRRDLQHEAGLCDRSIRLLLGGARIKDRYRGAYWTGEIKVAGAEILNVRALGFDHPEQCVWLKAPGTLGFSTVTHGDTDSIEMDLSSLPDARIEVHAAIHGYPKLGDPLNPPPHPGAGTAVLTTSGSALQDARRIEHPLPGVEMRLVLERVTTAVLPRDLAGKIHLRELDLSAGREHPIFLTGRQRDQSRIWTSPVFLTP